MVSNARLDFPEPERPVTTTRQSRGISSEMFLRLWTRAPWTPIVVRAARGAAGTRVSGCRVSGSSGRRTGSEVIRRLSRMEEGDLLHRGIAPLRQADRGRRFDEQPPVRQVLAS